VYLGIVYSYLPFMIMPLYSNLEKNGSHLVGSSGRFRLFVRLAPSCTSPCRYRGPGIRAGCMLVFIPAVGEYVIPALLGPPESLMIGKCYGRSSSNNRDWPVASAVAIALLLVLVAPIVYLQRAQTREASATS